MINPNSMDFYGVGRRYIVGISGGIWIVDGCIRDPVITSCYAYFACVHKIYLYQVFGMLFIDECIKQHGSITIMH